MATIKCIRPLVLTQEQYDRLRRAKAGEKEALDTERQEIYKQLDEASKKMTRSWPNSLENVNKRNAELRQARLDAAEQANKKFYEKYKKRKQEEQERMMYSARDIIFKNKDASKLLLSAVIETAVQKERQVQLEFKAEQKRKKDSQWAEYDANLWKNAEEWHKKKNEQKKMQFDVNKQHQKDLLEQAKETADRKRKEYQEELEMQIKDRINGQKEMDDLKAFELKTKEEARKRIIKDIELVKSEYDARKNEMKARDSLDDQLIQVLDRSKCRINTKTKETEARIKGERSLIIEQLSKRLQVGSAKRDAKEQDILAKAIKEREQAEEAQRQARIEKENRIRQERIELRRQYLEEEEEKKKEMESVKQWELLNRLKKDELFKKFTEKSGHKNLQKIHEYRDELLAMAKERKDREEAERKDRLYFFGELAEKRMRETDNRVFIHTKALLQEARENGRPELPIHKAIDFYCKVNRLYPMPDLPKSQQEHFSTYAPWDKSQADPWYKYPLPPRCDTYVSPMPHYPRRQIFEQLVPKDPEPEPEPDTKKAGEMRKKSDKPPKEKRDGLQAMIKRAAAVQTLAGGLEEAAVCEDYKRLGPANGLQRQLEIELDLPYSGVIPYKPACDCYHY